MGKYLKDIKVFYGKEIDDLWVVYPWEAVDLDDHNSQTKQFIVCYFVMYLQPLESWNNIVHSRIVKK